MAHLVREEIWMIGNYPTKCFAAHEIKYLFSREITNFFQVGRHYGEYHSSLFTTNKIKNKVQIITETSKQLLASIAYHISYRWGKYIQTSTIYRNTYNMLEQ